jgi:hypothetical protein
MKSFPEFILKLSCLKGVLGWIEIYDNMNPKIKKSRRLKKRKNLLHLY